MCLENNLHGKGRLAVVPWLEQNNSHEMEVKNILGKKGYTELIVLLGTR